MTRDIVAYNSKVLIRTLWIYGMVNKRVVAMEFSRASKANEDITKSNRSNESLQHVLLKIYLSAK